MQRSQKLRFIFLHIQKEKRNTYISNMRTCHQTQTVSILKLKISQLNSNQHIGLKKKKKRKEHKRLSHTVPVPWNWNRLAHRAHERAASATWNVEFVPRKDRNRKMRYDKCSVLSMTKPRRRNEHGREMWHTPRPRHYWTSPMANLVNGSRQPSLNFG